MKEVIGVGGEMQQSAGDRWGKGDGSGGFIGIDSDGVVCMDMNSGGMFRGTVVDGRPIVAVYRDEELHY
jgi:L-asparaginase